MTKTKLNTATIETFDRERIKRSFTLKAPIFVWREAVG